MHDEIGVHGTVDNADMIDGLFRACGILMTLSAFVGFGVGWLACKALS